MNRLGTPRERVAVHPLRTFGTLVEPARIMVVPDELSQHLSDALELAAQIRFIWPYRNVDDIRTEHTRQLREIRRYPIEAAQVTDLLCALYTIAAFPNSFIRDNARYTHSLFAIDIRIKGAGQLQLALNPRDAETRTFLAGALASYPQYKGEWKSAIRGVMAVGHVINAAKDVAPELELRSTITALDSNSKIDLLWGPFGDRKGGICLQVKSTKKPSVHLLNGRVRPSDFLYRARFDDAQSLARGTAYFNHQINGPRWLPAIIWVRVRNDVQMEAERTDIVKMMENLAREFRHIRVR